MSDTTHIVISKELHALLKKYCLERGLVMRRLVEKIIKEYFDEKIPSELIIMEETDLRETERLFDLSGKTPTTGS